MSGKSTLLRTVGINAVLALAGAPVRARRLRLSLAGRRGHAPDPGFAPGRPLAVLCRDHPGPAVGRPRREGRCPSCSSSTSCSTARTRTTAASAPRRSSAGLIDRGAIGLVTTHDLTLAQIADTPGTAGRQRPLRGPARGRQDALRLPDAAGRRPAQQCPGPDARDWAGGVSSQPPSTDEVPVRAQRIRIPIPR